MLKPISKPKRNANPKADSQSQHSNGAEDNQRHAQVMSVVSVAKTDLQKTENVASKDETQTVKILSIPSIDVEVAKDLADYGLVTFSGMLVVITAFQLRLTQQQSHISQAAERAYVYVKVENVGGIEVGQRPQFTFVIRNFGHTPAYHVRYQATWSVAEFPMQRNYGLPPLGEIASPEITIVPGIESSAHLVGANPVTEEHIQKITDLSFRLLILGQVEYQDAFRLRHYTRFAFFHVGRDADGQDQFMIAPVGNDAD